MKTYIFGKENMGKSTLVRLIQADIKAHGRTCEIIRLDDDEVLSEEKLKEIKSKSYSKDELIVVALPHQPIPHEIKFDRIIEMK